MSETRLCAAPTRGNRCKRFPHQKHVSHCFIHPAMRKYFRLARLYHVHYQFRDIFRRIGRRAPANKRIDGFGSVPARDQVLVKIALRDSEG